MVEEEDIFDEDMDTTTLGIGEEDESVDEATFFKAPDNELTIIGHAEIIEHLEQLAGHSKMPHALLFSGTRGIGKSLVAQAFARMLLTASPHMQVRNDHPVVTQMQAGSLAEYVYISGEHKGDEIKEKASLIDIEQIRGIGQMLGLTRASCPYRVIIIDGAEDMNTNAANALLKNLEEPPPHTVMILITHNAARLLPTIRSRCRILNFKPLTIEECQQVISEHTSERNTNSTQFMAQLAQASPGLAIEWLERGGEEIYSSIVTLFAENREEHAELKHIHEVLDEFLSDKSTIHASFRVFSGLMLALLARASMPSIAYMSDAEEKAIRKFRQAFTAERLTDLWFDVSEQFSIAQGLHLDYKNTLVPLLVRLSRGKEPLPLKPF